MKIKTKLFKKNAKLPMKKHREDFAYDLVATDCQWISDRIVVYKVGLGFEPKRCLLLKLLRFMRISLDARPRSSVWKSGLILSNCVGTIDEIFRGEVSAVFYRLLDEGTEYEYNGQKGKIEHYKVGDRIAQLHVSLTTGIKFIPVDELTETDRGDGSYGSTGR